MGDPTTSLPACPICGTTRDVVAKLLLIGKQSPEPDFCGPRKDQFAVDECTPEQLQASPLEQILNGFYCRMCDTGFVPDCYERR